MYYWALPDLQLPLKIIRSIRNVDDSHTCLISRLISSMVMAAILLAISFSNKFSVWGWEL